MHFSVEAAQPERMFCFGRNFLIFSQSESELGGG